MPYLPLLSFVNVVVRGRSRVASATDAKFEHEYLVKFKTMSYVHVQWLTAQEIGELEHPILWWQIYLFFLVS